MLGLGTDSLPVQDEVATIEIIRRAIDGGVNYIDLGLPYDIAAHGAAGPPGRPGATRTATGRR